MDIVTEKKMSVPYDEFDHSDDGIHETVHTLLERPSLLLQRTQYDPQYHGEHHDTQYIGTASRGYLEVSDDRNVLWTTKTN